MRKADDGQAHSPAGDGRTGHDHYDDAAIRRILSEVKTIAMVGASANDVRPSYFVLKYLHAKGYTVHPVNPGQAGKTILGRTVYASLADVPGPIDMIDIFRPVEMVPGIVEEALALEPKPKVIWMQLAIRHDEAAARAEAAGIEVIMNRCPKIEYGRLSGEIGWTGYNSGQISSKRRKPQSGFQHLGLKN